MSNILKSIMMMEVKKLVRLNLVYGYGRQKISTIEFSVWLFTSRFNDCPVPLQFDKRI
jgi:hypothetical protein